MTAAGVSPDVTSPNGAIAFHSCSPPDCRGILRSFESPALPRIDQARVADGVLAFHGGVALSHGSDLGSVPLVERLRAAAPKC
jgi:hypothetical protein